MIKIIPFVLTLALSGAVYSKDKAEALRDRLRVTDTPRILFVGNSYSFKIPKALGRIAADSDLRLVVEGVTRGGWTLEKHARSEDTLNRIRGGRWDVVVLQEQSQRPAFSKAQRTREMIPHVRSLTAEIRKAGAVPVFFQTWGRRDGDRSNRKIFSDDTFEKMQKRLVTGYEEAAMAAGHALIVRVGEGWAREVSKGRGARLFTRDGSHPSSAGVELTARIFYDFFFGP